MKKGIAFKRYDTSADKSKDELLQDTLIRKWAATEKVEILKEMEAVSHADSVFNEKGWKELDKFVKENAMQLAFIVTARFSTLCHSDMYAVMEKAEYFQDLGITMSIASSK